MKVGGFGELENIRKAVQKDGTSGSKAAKAEGSVRSEAPREDAVQISSSAKAMGKLQSIPDVRQEKIDEILARAERGELLTPDAVREGVARMIAGML